MTFHVTTCINKRCGQLINSTYHPQQHQHHRQHQPRQPRLWQRLRWGWSPPSQPSTTMSKTRQGLPGSGRAAGLEMCHVSSPRCVFYIYFQHFISTNEYIYSTVAMWHVNVSKWTRWHCYITTPPPYHSRWRQGGQRAHGQVVATSMPHHITSQSPNHHTQPRHTTATMNGAWDDRLDTLHHPLHSGCV